MMKNATPYGERAGIGQREEIIRRKLPFNLDRALCENGALQKGCDS